LIAVDALVISGINSPEPEAFIHKALDLLSSDRYLEKGVGLMALSGRRQQKFSLAPF
jgi:hypothetical protein